MGNYVKSISDAKRISSGLVDLKEEVSSQTKAIVENSKELKKINDVAQLVQQEKILKLEEEIEQMKENQKWVRSEEPAFDYKPDNILRKLNVL